MDENEAQEKLAAMRAEMDQAIEGIKGMARATSAMYNELRDEGFGRGDAMKLTQTWISATVSGRPGNDEGS